MKRILAGLLFLVIFTPAVFADVIEFTDDYVIVDCDTAAYCQPVKGRWDSEYFYIYFKKPGDFNKIVSAWRKQQWKPTYTALEPIMVFEDKITIRKDYISSIGFFFGSVKLAVYRDVFFQRGMAPLQWERVLADYGEWIKQ